MKFAFTVDVEDWYQGVLLPLDSWSKYEHRIEKGLDKLLFLLSENGIKATFFTLGWIAEKHPAIIKKIFAEGHELASHGYSHEIVYGLTPETFRKDIRETKDLIENVTGKAINAYRAPFFSITSKSLWAIKILAEENYTIDSSISPVKTWRYGISTCPKEIFKFKDLDLIEFPVSTFKFLNKSLAHGGAYFRIFPYFLHKYHLNKRMKRNQHTMFYIHPWEYDPDHPVIEIEKKTKLTHYTNLQKTYPNTAQLFKDFKFGPLSEVLADYQSTNTFNEVDIKILQD